MAHLVAQGADVSGGRLQAQLQVGFRLRSGRLGCAPQPPLLRKHLSRVCQLRAQLLSQKRRLLAHRSQPLLGKGNKLTLSVTSLSSETVLTLSCEMLSLQKRSWAAASPGMLLGEPLKVCPRQSAFTGSSRWDCLVLSMSGMSCA